MADHRDPFDILRDNNPVDPRSVDAYSATADGILASVTSAPLRRTAPRRRLVIVAVATLALAAGVAMTIALTQKDVTNMAITCYQEVSLESSRAGLVAEGVPDASACEQPWRDGALTMEGIAPGEVPPLTACVTDLGGLAVFPTDDPMVCEELGLAVPTPGQPTGRFDTIAAMKEDIFSYLDAGSCRPLDEAEVVFREILDRHGFTDWIVDRRPDYPGRPCASIAYHVEDRMLMLVPLPDLDAESAAGPPDGPSALPEAVSVEGDAPIVVKDLDTGVAIDVERLEQPLREDLTKAPPGSALELLSCSTAYPGVVVFEMELSAPPDAEFPATMSVALTSYAGDVGIGEAVDVTVDGPGRMAVTSRSQDRYRQDERDVFLRRTDADRTGLMCGVEAFGDENISGGYSEFTSEPMALAVTAPSGSLEWLLQQQPPTDGPLEPLQKGYGTGLEWFADVMYLPDDPPMLQEVEQHLSDDNACLQLKFKYDEYTLTQERGCGRVSPIGLWEAGDGWFAAARGSGWEVLVLGPSEEGVRDLVDRLQPYTVLSTKPLPIVPGDEMLVGWVEFEGEDLMVTVGEQRCTNNCRSPEQWFFLYKVDGTELIPYADYPAWDHCLLVEEEPWTLAIAPSAGSIVIETATGTETIVHDGEWPALAVALVPTGEADSVMILDHDGGEPYCLAKLEGDGRGGIVDPAPATSTTTTTIPAKSEGELIIEPCGYDPPYPEDYSSKPFYASGCAQTPARTHGVGRFYPDGFIMAMEDEPIPGVECMIEWYGNSSSGGPCLDESGGFAFAGGYSSYDDGYAFTMGLVSDDTIRVVAVTDRGEELVAIPYERMVFLWWPVGAELVSVVAETPSGDIDLLALGG